MKRCVQLHESYHRRPDLFLFQTACGGGNLTHVSCGAPQDILYVYTLQLHCPRCYRVLSRNYRRWFNSWLPSCWMALEGRLVRANRAAMCPKLPRPDAWVSSLPRSIDLLHDIRLFFSEFHDEARTVSSLY